VCMLSAVQCTLHGTQHTQLHLLVKRNFDRFITFVETNDCILYRLCPRYLTDTFSNDELTWDTMARRELQGLAYLDTQFQGESSPNTSPQGTVESGEDRVNSKSCLKQRIK